MKKFLAILLLGFSSCYAQTATAVTTPNLITSGTTHTWYGVTTGALPSNYMPGGPQPIYDPSTNTVSFSYGSASIGQTYAVNQALANVGAGVKINGYTYSYDVRNMNGDDRQPGVDAFTVSQLLRGPQNSVLLNSSQYYNTKFDWRTVTGSRTTTTPYNIADTSYIQFGVQGADNGFWSGYFGPQIRNVDMRLNYTVDPCVSNPAYSPSCPNYGANILTSPNLLSGTTGTQAYAINQALNLVGSGVMIHGFNYGYNYNVGGTQCTATNQDGSCSWWMSSTASVVTTIKDNANAVIYSQSENYTGPTSGSKNVNYLFPTSRNLASLSAFKMAVGTSGNASITGMYSNAIYTPDWCAQNPTYSSTCPGYADAVDQLMFSGMSTNQVYALNTALASSGSGVLVHGFKWGYDASVGGRYCNFLDIFGGCIGSWIYPSASTTMEVTDIGGNVIAAQTNSHSSTTDGTVAYQYKFPTSRNSLTLGNFSLSKSTANGATITNMWGKVTYTPDQCYVDPLSSQNCPGYTAAYLNQQCTINALYDSSCPGYAQALFTQQCNANQLSSQSCPGYAAAYLTQQCTLDPLYSTTCSGYETAYFNQQCSLDPLYNSRCPGYTTAYHNQQCSLDPLYASDCTGYAAAYKTQQCTADPLYATDCPGYAAAYKTQQCTANALYATDCPGYAQAYLNQQCLRDSLYSTQCEGYKTAYAIKYLVGLDSAVTTSVNASLTNTVETQRNDPTNVTGTVDAYSTATGTTSTSSTTAATTSATSVSPVAVISTVKPTAPAPVTATVAQAEPKKDEKKEEAKKDNASPNAGPSNDTKPNDQPKSNREALQERRREAAQKEAVAKGKDLANEMGKAADMESQKAVQNVVIQAMGFTPGFDTYNKAMLPDSRFYKPYTVYGGQVNVDNRNVSRRLMGGSDILHQDMVDSQYKLGDK